MHKHINPSYLWVIGLCTVVHFFVLSQFYKISIDQRKTNKCYQKSGEYSKQGIWPEIKQDCRLQTADSH